MKTLNLKKFVGKEVGEVFNYLLKNHRDEIVSIDDVDLDKLPKDDVYYFFFGSIVRSPDGHWYVPYARWGWSRWGRNTYWLAYSWYSEYRVVLREKIPKISRHHGW